MALLPGLLAVLFGRFVSSAGARRRCILRSRGGSSLRLFARHFNLCWLCPTFFLRPPTFRLRPYCAARYMTGCYMAFSLYLGALFMRAFAPLSWVAFEYGVRPASCVYSNARRSPEDSFMVVDADVPGQAGPGPLRLISRSRALALVAPDLWLAGDPPNTAYRFGTVPLASFSSNGAGDLFDSTVDRQLADRYRSMKTPAPPVLAVERPDGSLGLLDGGHRITAARLRGDVAITAIVCRRTVASA